MSKAEKIILLTSLAVLIAFVCTVWLLNASDWSAHL
jgi:hypothetical protein